MPPKGMSRNQAAGLTYVANTPSFLKNFGKAPPSPPPASRSSDPSTSRPGREPLPERPSEGKWAKGSDDEGGNNPDGSDDEWGEVFGGGGEDGPQVVVLKEGRHLSADEVKRERRRAHQKSSSAAGKPSRSPSPEADKSNPEPTEAKSKPSIQRTQHSSAKRKLVGHNDEETPEDASLKKANGDKKKRKKKMDKGLLSFNEAEGES